MYIHWGMRAHNTLLAWHVREKASRSAVVGLLQRTYVMVSTELYILHLYNFAIVYRLNIKFCSFPSFYLLSKWANLEISTYVSHQNKTNKMLVWFYKYYFWYTYTNNWNFDNWCCSFATFLSACSFFNFCFNIMYFF